MEAETKGTERKGRAHNEKRWNGVNGKVKQGQKQKGMKTRNESAWKEQNRNIRDGKGTITEHKRK